MKLEGKLQTETESQLNRHVHGSLDRLAKFSSLLDVSVDEHASSDLLDVSLTDVAAVLMSFSSVGP